MYQVFDTSCSYLCSVKREQTTFNRGESRNNRSEAATTTFNRSEAATTAAKAASTPMKKYAILLVIAIIIVSDLMLSGLNVLVGLVIIGASLVAAHLLDNASRQPKRTTSITRAAREHSMRQRTAMSVAAA